MKKLILTLVAILSLLITEAQTGNIKGNIVTPDKQPAEFFNILLKGTDKVASVTTNGEFEIKDVDAGIYTLVVSFTGIKTVELPVEVKLGETTIVPTISLGKSSKALKEVTVTAFKSTNETINEIGKSPIKPIDLPQSVASINKEVLEEQQTLRLSDAVKNFNGVYVMGTSGGYQEELAGRGFAYGSNNTFKNGVRYNNTVMPEMNSLERIDIMKGSAAILFGNVAAGGVLNLVTKKPLFETGGEVSMRLGSYDFYKPSFDVYGALDKNKTAAYRLNMSYEKSRSFRDVVNAERIYFNPSFLVKLGKKTDLLIEGDYLNDKRTADFGVGAIDYQLIEIPRSRFVGVAWSHYNAEQKSATATITHHFNNNWQIKSATGYQSVSTDLFANQRPNGGGQFIQPNGDWIRGLQRTKIKEDYYITQLDLTGKFSTGMLKHILLFGADADKYQTQNIAYNPMKVYDVINVFDPSKYIPRTDIPQLTEKTVTSSPVDRVGIYVQDLVSITEQLKVLAGIRFSYLENATSVYTYEPSGSEFTKQYSRAFTPRLGLVYKPLKTMCVFASYANSFTPNSGTDIDGKPLAPSFIDQYEVGIKNDLFHGVLTANVTVYQIKNSNFAQMSLEKDSRGIVNTDKNVKEMSGEITSNGIEIDLVSKSYKGFSAIAGYSFNETKYTKSTMYSIGTVLRYNPKNTANASVYYNFNTLNVKWLTGFNAGAGVLYIGDRLAGRDTRLTETNDTYKQMPLPAYTSIDASIGYTKGGVFIRVKMSNILNALSYNVHDDNSVNPIAPRQIAGTVGFKF